MSARTSQRHINAEGYSFKNVVSATREELARHYVENTNLRCAKTVYLLRFEETSSFFRAFRDWISQTALRLRHETKFAYLRSESIPMSLASKLGRADHMLFK